MHLADDLACGQIAHELLRAGVAEAAGQRAADLARNAQGAAVFLGDIDGLDLLPAAARVGGEPQQPFAGAVGGNLLGDDLKPADAEMLVQRLAQLLGDIGHGGEGGDAAMIDPAPDLAHAHAALPLGHAGKAQRRGQFVAAEANQVAAGIGKWGRHGGCHITAHAQLRMLLDIPLPGGERKGPAPWAREGKGERISQYWRGVLPLTLALSPLGRGNVMLRIRTYPIRPSNAGCVAIMPGEREGEEHVFEPGAGADIVHDQGTVAIGAGAMGDEARYGQGHLKASA